MQTKQLRNDEQAQLESDEQFSQKNKGVAQWRCGAVDAVAQWRYVYVTLTLQRYGAVVLWLSE